MILEKECRKSFKDSNFRSCMAGQNSSELDYYKMAIELITYEGQRLWQVFHLYLITQVLLIGSLIGTRYLDLDISIVIGFAGLLLCIPWAGAYFRHSQWYIYRMEDAKEIEGNLGKGFLRKKREFGIFEEIFSPMNLTGLVITGISFVYLFLLYKLNVPCLYLSILVIIPLIILHYHFYLIMQWRRKEKEKNRETQPSA